MGTDTFYIWLSVFVILAVLAGTAWVVKTGKQTMREDEKAKTRQGLVHHQSDDKIIN